MGVSSLINRVPYVGDGSTTSFSFPEYFFSTTDLLVYQYDTVLGGTTLLDLGVDYTVSGTPNAQGLYPSGASVVCTVAPATTDILIIIRAPPEEQNYALQQNGNISSTALVQQMDYLTLLIQRLEDQVSRCIQLPDGTGSTFSNQLPTNAPLLPEYYLRVNQAANGWELTTTLSPIQEIVVPYTSAQVAGTSKQILAFSLPAGTLLTYVVIKHTAAFAGTLITGVHASIGTNSTPTQFVNAFDVHQAPGDTVYDSTVANFIGSFGSATDIYLTMTSTGTNLSALNDGSLNVWYAYAAI